MTAPAPNGFKSRVIRALNPRASQLAAELSIERDRISKLETEVIELRRDSLRIAELTDLIEARLTPSATIHDHNE